MSMASSLSTKEEDALPAWGDRKRSHKRALPNWESSAATRIVLPAPRPKATRARTSSECVQLHQDPSIIPPTRAPRKSWPFGMMGGSTGVESAASGAGRRDPSSPKKLAGSSSSSRDRCAGGAAGGEGGAPSLKEESGTASSSVIGVKASVTQGAPAIQSDAARMNVDGMELAGEDSDNEFREGSLDTSIVNGMIEGCAAEVEKVASSLEVRTFHSPVKFPAKQSPSSKCQPGFPKNTSLVDLQGAGKKLLMQGPTVGDAGQVFDAEAAMASLMHLPVMLLEDNNYQLVEPLPEMQVGQAMAQSPDGSIGQKIVSSSFEELCEGARAANGANGAGADSQAQAQGEESAKNGPIGMDTGWTGWLESAQVPQMIEQVNGDWFACSPPYHAQQSPVDTPYAHGYGQGQRARNCIGPGYQAEIQRFEAPGEAPDRARACDEEADRPPSSAVRVWDPSLVKDAQASLVGSHTPERPKPVYAVTLAPASSQTVPMPTISASSSKLELELLRLQADHASEPLAKKALETLVKAKSTVDAPWTFKDAVLFRQGAFAYRRCFRQIQKKYLTHKTYREIVAYYYKYWKQDPAYRVWNSMTLVGRHLCKEFEEVGMLYGKVKRFYHASETDDGRVLFQVIYVDDDSEDLYHSELAPLLVAPEEERSELPASWASSSSVVLKEHQVPFTPLSLHLSTLHPA